MVIAKIYVDGVCAKITELRKVPQGIIGATIEVTYSAEWSQLIKTAVFSGSTTKDVLGVGNTITIPAEVVAKPGHRLRVGFYGVSDNTLAIPTLWADLGNIQSATDPSGDSSTDPRLPVWAQLQEQIKNIELTPGPPGPAGKDGVDGQPGKDGYTPVKGKDYFDGDDYVITDKDKTEIADLVLQNEKIAQMQQDIADLKYVPIDITQITDNVVTMEMGSVVNEVTVSWTLNKEPASQTLDGVAVDLSARSKTIPGPFSTNKTFTLAVTDERGATDSASTAISFLNGVYYGVMEDGAEVDSSAILKLTKKLQGSKGITFTANAGASQRIVYAIPARYGTPNFNVGGFDGGFALAKTFDFTNASGHTESYAVWLSENVGLGSTTVKVT